MILVGYKPARVYIVKEEICDEKMLSIAKEFNLSETASIKKHKDETFSIRYFSPKMEIPLCGHATSAFAEILGEIMYKRTFER